MRSTPAPRIVLCCTSHRPQPDKIDSPNSGMGSIDSFCFERRLCNGRGRQSPLATESLYVATMPNRDHIMRGAKRLAGEVEESEASFI